MLDKFSTVAIFVICLSVGITSKSSFGTVNTNGIRSRTWDEAIAQAKALTTQMSLEEKVNMTAGIGGPCVGNVPSIQRLHFPGLCFQDSPSGVGDNVEFATAFVPGIHIAATWDRDLAYARASAIGQEFRGKGINFLLGPMINIDRNTLHGRNWEGFGADPYLSGENACEYVLGVQNQGVVATAKHYIANEQETNRFYGVTIDEHCGSRDVSSLGYSANLDDKTIHEIYFVALRC